jgi:hypothetical protein
MIAAGSKYGLALCSPSSYTGLSLLEITFGTLVEHQEISL